LTIIFVDLILGNSEASAICAQGTLKGTRVSRQTCPSVSFHRCRCVSVKCVERRCRRAESAGAPALVLPRALPRVRPCMVQSSDALPPEGAVCESMKASCYARQRTGGGPSPPTAARGNTKGGKQHRGNPPANRRTPRPCSVCGSPCLCRRRKRRLIGALFGRWPLAWRTIWAVSRFDLAV